MRHLHLFVPAPLSTLSGGYVYDRAMIDGLRALGTDVSVTELAGTHPLADDAAHKSAAAAWRVLPDGAAPLIDGLGLPAFAPLIPELEARGAAGLIHHPTALETGRDEDSRARLQSIERALFPRLRHIIVTSADTARRLCAEFGVDAIRITVVEPGTPDAPRSPGPARTPGCDILSIGTLTPRKGHDVLMRALARLPDLDFRLTIVGGGDPAYADELRALAGQLALTERMEFAGPLTSDALAPHWERAGIFALATHYEGYGMAIAESLRRGIPVAVTADPGLSERIPADAAVIAPPGDHVSLSNGLRRMIFDPELRRTMAEAAWMHGRELPDWPAQAKRLATALGQ